MLSKKFGIFLLRSLRQSEAFDCGSSRDGRWRENFLCI